MKESCLFVGNGALVYKNMILEKRGDFASFAPMIHNTIRASTVAHLSLAEFKNKNADQMETFSPHYIRESDAEMNLKRK